MKLKPWGIQQRAVFLALVPTAVIALALSAYFLAVRYGDVEAALQSRGYSLARQLAPAAEYGAFSGNRNELTRLTQAAAREPDVAGVAIYDSTGALIAGAGKPTPVKNFSWLQDGQRLVSADGSTEIFHAIIRQPAVQFDDMFQEAAPARGADPVLGHVVLELSRANLEARKREILGVTLLATVLVLATSLLLAYRLGRDITEPVMALQDAVARVRAGRHDVRLPPHPSGTLQALETGFNEMAAALDAVHRRSASALAQSEAELARQLELAQTRQEEAERASEGKSRFLAAASHDLRQPLHALTLFATELSATASKANRRLVSQIVTAAGAMTELLDALLEVSRLDVAAVEPQRRSVALGPLLETIADEHRESARIKNLKLVCRPTALWVDTDPHLLRRMIGNLMTNAVRYTHWGGILLGARVRGDRVRIDVWDTGTGIDEADLPHLFQEFYQVGNPERDASKGLGLGLAIVARLSQILDHPITVHSMPGRGSVFSISAPRAEPIAADQPAPPAGLPFRARIAVRTVDLRQCGDICNMLDSWGYERECACSDDELPATLDRHPAVLISDSASLAAVRRNLNGRAERPLLVVLEDPATGVPPGDLNPDGRLSLPARPARLRALLHHLLQEEGAEGEG